MENHKYTHPFLLKFIFLQKGYKKKTCQLFFIISFFVFFPRIGHSCDYTIEVIEGDNPIQLIRMDCFHETEPEANEACIAWATGLSPTPISGDECNGGITPDNLHYKWSGWFHPANRVQIFGEFYYNIICPAGTELIDNHCIDVDDDEGGQCPFEDGGGTNFGNPINSATGNKYHKEVIETVEGIDFELHYNSNFRRTFVGEKHLNTIAVGWTHTFSSFISAVSEINGQNVVFMNRPDGRQLRFTEINGVWTGPAYINATLTLNNGEWIYMTSSNVKETYVSPASYGGGGLPARLEQLNYPDGSTLSLNYVGDSATISHVVTDFADYPNHGPYLEFSYFSTALGERIDQMSDDQGRIWQFNYDANYNLIDIVFPDNTSKVYHYEDLNFQNALTGISDRRIKNGQNVRFSTYGYDSLGRANYEKHHAKDLLGNDLNVGQLTIVYNNDNTRTITNSRGEVSTYEVEKKNGLWQIKSIIGPGCSSCSNDNTDFVYDNDNNLVSKTQDGVTTKYFNYDAKGQYAYKIEAFGTTEARRTDYTYDNRFIGKVATVTEPSVYASGNKVTSYTYNNHGQMTSMTEAGYKPDGTAISRMTNYEYNGPFNQISRIDGPLPGVVDETLYKYYPETNPVPERRNRLKRVTGPEGIVERNNIRWSATGKVTEEQQPNGVSITNTYDPLNDRLVSVSQSDGAKTVLTQFNYLNTGQVESVIHNYGTSEATSLTMTYDDALRVTRVTDHLGNYVEYTLDTEGNEKAEKTYDPNGVLKKQIIQTFDAYDMLATRTQSTVTTNYDYGSNGTLDTQTNGNNVVTDYSYDSLKRLTQISRDFQGSDPGTANTNTLFSYDAGERVKTVMDARSNTTTYSFDDFGRLQQLDSPDTGITSYDYDLAGNIINKTDANSVSTTMSYDGRGRMTNIDYSDNALDTSFVYDQGSNGTGQLTSMSNGNDTTTLDYDAFGNLISKTQSFYNQSLNVSYTYDDYNRTASMIYPSGLNLVYGHDGLNRINAIKHKPFSGSGSGSDEVIVNSVNYLPFGPVNSYQYSNGIGFNANYDGGYRLQDYSYNNITNGNDIQAIYGYDGNHNITQISRETAALNDTYAYDRLDRLTDDNHLDFSYDKLGNRTSQQMLGQSVIDYVYANNSNRLLNVDSLSPTRFYDAAGNTTHINEGSSQTLSYNDANRLQSFTSGGVTTEYLYNGLGQRTVKFKQTATNDFSGTMYLYDDEGQLIHETAFRMKQSTFTIYHMKEYVWLDYRPVAMLFVKPGKGGVSRTWYHIMSDHLNTPRWITDTSGQVLWSWESDAFGSSLPNEDVDSDGKILEFNLRFPGQYYDSESGMHYNYFRDYDPRTGRYIESDPIGLGGGVNTYKYANSNPLFFADPLGERVLCVPNFTGPGCYERIYIPEHECDFISMAELEKSGCLDDPPPNNHSPMADFLCTQCKWVCGAQLTVSAGSTVLVDRRILSLGPDFSDFGRCIWQCEDDRDNHIRKRNEDRNKNRRDNLRKKTAMRERMYKGL